MPWLRLWTDILDDPDLFELPEATCWAWTLMLAIAKDYGHDGKLPDVRRLAHQMRKPREKVERWIEELTAAGLLERNGVTLWLHGWSRWQAPKDKTNAKRQAQWRARNKPPSGLPQDSEKREIESESKRDRYVTSSNGVTETLPDIKSTPTHPQADLLTGRTPSEHQLFLEVVQILERYPPTKHLSAQLMMAADTPEICGFPSWRLWVGAILIQRPNRSKDWPLFLSFCRNTNEDEHRKLKAESMAKSNESKPKIFGIVREGTT